MVFDLCASSSKTGATLKKDGVEIPRTIHGQCGGSDAGFMHVSGLTLDATYELIIFGMIINNIYQGGTYKTTITCGATRGKEAYNVGINS